jgi:hypothetical protein
MRRDQAGSLDDVLLSILYEYVSGLRGSGADGPIVLDDPEDLRGF